MDIELFDYALPQHLIAQKPHIPRDECKLMVYNKTNKVIEHRIFKDITSYLKKGDLLILNNTKVIPARIFAKKDTGGKIELFLLEEMSFNKYLCITKGKIKDKTRAFLKNNEEILIEKTDSDKRIVTFLSNKNVKECLQTIGEVPLPPYIKRDYNSYDKENDFNNYQTVFAKKEGAVAAPTAGIHFTKELLDNLHIKGVKIAYITLHVGIGTFRPVKEKTIENHKMHEERYEISAETAKIFNQTKMQKNRIVAVGTTAVRALESSANRKGYIHPTTSKTDIFIYPGYKYKAVDAMITNFHLPKSTLLMMISAFSSREEILDCYRNAIDNNYRFFSFGDAMFIY